MSTQHFAKLEIYKGPMRSGKSTKILDEAVKSAKVGLSTLFINSKKDNRNSESIFSTHNPVLKNKMEKELDDNLKMISESSLMSVIHDNRIDDYKCIVIDECQFFDDLEEFVLLALQKYQKRIIVGGLDGDSDQNNFGQLHKIEPWAHKSEKLHGYCQKCAENGLMVEAPYTFLSSKKDNVILVGNSIYQTLCLGCLLDARKKKTDSEV
jgi:thymidine kinase